MNSLTIEQLLEPMSEVDLHEFFRLMETLHSNTGTSEQFLKDVRREFTPTATSPYWDGEAV